MAYGILYLSVHPEYSRISTGVKISRSTRNGWHSTYFQMHFIERTLCILIQIAFMLFAMYSIDNKPGLMLNIPSSSVDCISLSQTTLYRIKELNIVKDLRRWNWQFTEQIYKASSRIYVIHHTNPICLTVWILPQAAKLNSPFNMASQ